WIVAFVLEEEKTAKDCCRLRTYIVNEANDGIRGAIAVIKFRSAKSTLTWGNFLTAYSNIMTF
ncbi:MAG: hypothetical protein KDD09_26370, partial [Phaeodactylibacter sp.]|nr:hypothetical protein [Phaeodactylibacter sp.]